MDNWDARPWASSLALGRSIVEALALLAFVAGVMIYADAIGAWWRG